MKPDESLKITTIIFHKTNLQFKFSFLKKNINSGEPKIKLPDYIDHVFFFF